MTDEQAGGASPVRRACRSSAISRATVCAWIRRPAVRDCWWSRGSFAATAAESTTSTCDTRRACSRRQPGDALQAVWGYADAPHAPCLAGRAARARAPVERAPRWRRTSGSRPIARTASGASSDGADGTGGRRRHQRERRGLRQPGAGRAGARRSTQYDARADPEALADTRSPVLRCRARRRRTAADAERVGSALRRGLPEDPFRPIGLEGSPAGDPIPSLVEAWADGCVERSPAHARTPDDGSASVQYTIAVIVALAVGLFASLALLWGSAPPRRMEGAAPSAPGAGVWRAPRRRRRRGGGIDASAGGAAVLMRARRRRRGGCHGRRPRSRSRSAMQRATRSDIFGV